MQGSKGSLCDMYSSLSASTNLGLLDVGSGVIGLEKFSGSWRHLFDLPPELSVGLSEDP